ncbi:hypothetical protein F4802DRAFT_78000 [Xylaria palmicola]|nr:hypothetical protein F4802DRAFT_78000 [Xylaria palmicola]
MITTITISGLAYRADSAHRSWALLQYPAHNNINNALLGIEVLLHVKRLRAGYPSADKLPARRTGKTLR